MRDVIAVVSFQFTNTSRDLVLVTADLSGRQSRVMDCAVPGSEVAPKKKKGRNGYVTELR